MTNVPRESLLAGLTQSFDAWAAGYVFAELVALPGMSWLGLPLISGLTLVVLEQIITILTRGPVMQGLFAAAAAVKAAEADAYAAAVAARRAVPPAAPKDDHAKAEAAELDAFRRLVVG